MSSLLDVAGVTDGEDHSYHAIDGHEENPLLASLSSLQLTDENDNANANATTGNNVRK